MKTIIRLTSVTYAIRAQKLLERQGMRSYIKKLASNMSEHGCGYGLEVDANQLQQALEEITKAGIRVVAIEEE